MTSTMTAHALLVLVQLWIWLLYIDHTSWWIIPVFSVSSNDIICSYHTCGCGHTIDFDHSTTWHVYIEASDIRDCRMTDNVISRTVWNDSYVLHVIVCISTAIDDSRFLQLSLLSGTQLQSSSCDSSPPFYSVPYSSKAHNRCDGNSDALSYKKLISRWESKRELSLRLHRTRTRNRRRSPTSTRDVAFAIRHLRILR